MTSQIADLEPKSMCPNCRESRKMMGLPLGFPSKPSQSRAPFQRERERENPISTDVLARLFAAVRFTCALPRPQAGEGKAVKKVHPEKPSIGAGSKLNRKPQALVRVTIYYGNPCWVLILFPQPVGRLSRVHVYWYQLNQPL